MLKTIEAPLSDIFNHYYVRKVLGKGGEGTVYLVEDKESSNKFILKVFHEPHSVDWLPGLPVYAEKIKANDFGLPEVEVIYSGDEINGVVYPYVQLRSLHWRILNSIKNVAQSVVGSYCDKQYYLMSDHSLALWDPHLSNFMVDETGKWHYSDIGGGICPLDHPWARKHGVIGYGFASLLLSIYNINLHQHVSIVEDYSYDEPCIYCKNEWLDAIAMQHEWVHEILSEVVSNKASIFYDPEFYQRLRKYLPNRVPWPSLVLPISKTLTGLGKLRGKLGL